MLSELHREGTALLLTTHQLDEAQAVAERITILDHGQAVATGTFAELLEQTVGRHRRLTARFAGGRIVTQNTEDLGADLLRLIGQESGPLQDVRIEAPNLQAVFLHLTGRELRE
jgi:ABC-2 type transport system ATP-binding protein